MNEEIISPQDFDINGDPEPDNHLCMLSKYDQYRITDLTPIPEPEPVLSICGQIVATVEDFCCIVGAPKSGKSALQNMFIAAAITETGQIPDGVEGVVVLSNSSFKAVVHIDTEQARHKHQRNIKNILRRSGFSSCPDHFLSYNIRQLDLADFADVTTGICEAAFGSFNGIHSLWLDGGADFIPDVNDPITSNAIIKFFEGLAIKYHTAVFIIVHTNPGSDKERGNFGSQAQRKSGGTILVKEDNDSDTSTIELKRLRYGGKSNVPQLQFMYDEDKGYHVGCGIKQGKGSDPEIKAQQKIKEAWNICEYLFSGQRSLSRIKTINAIMVKKACQNRTAAGIFALMTAGEMIIKGEDENYRINSQHINNLQ